MSVTITEQSHVGLNQYRIVWSSNLTDPTYYVYRDGELIDTTKQTSIIITIDADEYPTIEVFDDSFAVPTAYPSRITLRWYSTPDTYCYKVQERVQGTWIDRIQIDDLGQGYFIWTSSYLADCSLNRFRVLPIGTNGNEGDAAPYSYSIARNPNPPDVQYIYNSVDRKVTING